jgi:DNA adenine methylase
MKNNERFYYRVRAIDLDTLPPFTPGLNSARAARMIYLNKTCFNGLHRVNRAGKFNVPFGYYPKPVICDVPNLLACSNAFKRAHLVLGQFVDTTVTAGRGDLVYFDPPYFPISDTSNFTAYGSDGFGWSHHIALFEHARMLKKRGVHVVVSNSASPRIITLYKSDPIFKVETIQAARSINASADGRGKISELIIS